MLTKRRKILHIIPWVEQGGAEAMLANLLREDGKNNHHHVFSLAGGRNFFEIDQNMLTTGQGRRGRVSFDMIWKLNACLERFKPDIVHGWLYHGNLATCLASLRGTKVIWSINNDVLPREITKTSTHLANRLCASLSRVVPQQIVYVGESARRGHEAFGYEPAKSAVISNGIDLARFDRACFHAHKKPKDPKNIVRVSIVSRYEPGKGHHFLIDTIARHPARTRLMLQFAGRDTDRAGKLRDHLVRVNLIEQSRLLGAVRDMEQFYANTDILIIPSFSEAHPMSLLEAAAMETIICASRVGSISQLGIPERFLFAPGSKRALAEALSAAIDAMDDPGIGSFFRKHVAKPHDIVKTVRKYNRLYESVVKGLAPVNHGEE